MIQQIRPAQGGKGGIVRFEQVLIEGIHVTPQGESLSHPRISGQKQDAAPAFDIVESCRGLFKGFGLQDILGLEVLIKRKSFQSKPGEEVFHGRTSPLWKDR